MTTLVAELDKPKTTRARALWSWLLASFAFCVGAFAHHFGLPTTAMMALVVLLWVTIIEWVGCVPQKSRYGAVWWLASVIGMAAAMAVMFGLTLWLS